MNLTKEEVVGLIGHQLGIGGLAFDELGFCTLQLDETKLLLLTWDDESGRLGLNAEIGSAGGSDGTDVLRAAMSFNLVAASRGRAVCGLDDDTSTVFLIWSIPTLEAGEVEADLQAFFDTYHECLGRVASYEHAAKLMEGDESTAPEGQGLNLIKA